MFNENAKGSVKFLAGVVVVLVVAVLLGIGVKAWRWQSLPKVDASSYQAVFLDNNQQYFGHLKEAGTRHPYLTDIYYIQIQPGEKTKDTEQVPPKFTLIKLGNEIHGPEDMMYLNPSKILFWENLKSDSQVVQGIMKEKAQRATGGTSQNSSDSTSMQPADTVNKQPATP